MEEAQKEADEEAAIVDEYTKEEKEANEEAENATTNAEK